jgi:hypothetical protein
MQELTNFEKRNNLRVCVDIILNKYIKGRPYLCKATNLSRSGFLLHRIHEPFSTERHVGIQFQLPNDERVITCAGKIVHQHSWQKSHGIQFTSVAPEHQRIIDDFLMQQMSDAD